MKRIWFALAIILGLQVTCLPAQAAEAKVIRLVTEPNRNYSGYFYSDALATRLAPSGDLGRLVFYPASRPRTWVVDTAFIEDVIAMKEKYKIGLEAGEKIDGTGSEVAANWLTQFSFITRSDQVVVLPYGNPAYQLAKNYAPGELNFYYSKANKRLASFLARPVISDKAGKYSSGAVKNVDSLRQAYSQNRKALTTLNRVVDAPELTTLRLQLSRLLNPDIDNGIRLRLIKSATKEVTSTTNKLKIISGRYRLTSAVIKLPVTLVNNFSTPIKVSLELVPRNSRIQISGISDISIAPNSKMQLLIPANVITPGTVTVAARLTDAKGVPITKYAQLNLNLSIVDYRVAWFTSSSAVLLFVAATLQTIRRVRRSKKSNQ
jgi:hypothetical protein